MRVGDPDDATANLAPPICHRTPEKNMPTLIPAALGLRAQLAAAAVNELGNYLARNDRSEIRGHIDRSAARAAAHRVNYLKGISGEDYAAIDKQILQAIKMHGEMSASDVAEKIGKHYTCAFKHLNRLESSGGVIKLMLKSRSFVFRIAPIEQQK